MEQANKTSTTTISRESYKLEMEKVKSVPGYCREKKRTDDEEVLVPILLADLCITTPSVGSITITFHS